MTSLKRSLKLTAAQVEILNHRLQVDDAICEALGYPYGTPDVVDICAFLLADDLGAALLRSTQLTYDILEDAVSGSVFCAARGEDLSYERHGNLKIANMQRAAESLARHVSLFIGREVEIPLD